MNRYALAIVACVIGAGIVWRFPLFHVVSIEQAKAGTGVKKFVAADFSQNFWTEELKPSFAKATNAAELVIAIHADSESARQQFGKSVGIGRAYFYFLQGQGTIAVIDKLGVSVECSETNPGGDIVLKSGPLFGNTIRDATGLLKSSSFSNSQDFNDLSKELNQIVESKVQPLLKDAIAGSKIRFVGCAEVRGSNKNVLPLIVVPLDIEIIP